MGRYTDSLELHQSHSFGIQGNVIRLRRQWYSDQNMILRGARERLHSPEDNLVVIFLCMKTPVRINHPHTEVPLAGFLIGFIMSLISSMTENKVVF